MNRHKVPKKTWQRWSKQARAIFNEMYGTMRKNAWVFTHPKAEKVPREHWKTTAWNVAWTAADFINKTPMTTVQDVKLAPKGRKLKK